MLLELIEQHPDERLELPEQGDTRAALADVNLSTEALGPTLSSERAADAAWWNSEKNALSLRGADLRGAMLRGSVLRGVDLRGADLRGAAMGGCDLRGAQLENADLREADLVNARLEEALLGGANLKKALLENAQLRGAYLRFAHLQYCALDQADLRDADLWGADLEGASLSSADLRGALLHEANLQDAMLKEADLRGADLRDAVLREADLRETNLEGTQLQRAVLQRARLQSMNLTRSNLENAYFGAAQLGQTRLEQRQLGGVIGEEMDGDYETASYGYLALEQNFANLGDPDAARWAYTRKRTMQKLDARQQARQALQERQWRAAGRHGMAYAQAKIVEQMCGYGESIPRTLGSVFIVYVVFVVLYGLTGSVVRAQAPGATVGLWPLSDLTDLATFGLITMTAPEGPQVGMHPSGDFAHLLTSLQTLITIGLTGLLGYVLGNRIHR